MYPHLGECFKTKKILSCSTHFISHLKFGPWPKNDQKIGAYLCHTYIVRKPHENEISKSKKKKDLPQLIFVLIKKSPIRNQQCLLASCLSKTEDSSWVQCDKHVIIVNFSCVRMSEVSVYTVVMSGLVLLVATWNCWTSYKSGYVGLLVLHLLILLNPWLIVEMWPA